MLPSLPHEPRRKFAMPTALAHRHSSALRDGQLAERSHLSLTEIGQCMGLSSAKLEVVSVEQCQWRDVESAREHLIQQAGKLGGKQLVGAAVQLGC